MEEPHALSRGVLCFLLSAHYGTYLAYLNHQPYGSALFLGYYYVDEGRYDHYIDVIGLQVIASDSNGLDRLVRSAGPDGLHVGPAMVPDNRSDSSRHRTGP